MLKTVIAASVLGAIGFTHPALSRTATLEEVTVTAQKREQSLQEAPIAISVLTESQLAIQGITSLFHLMNGTLSSVQITESGSDPATLVLAIRGNGPGDITQTTREGSVAVYLDDIYLGRAQSLSPDLADLLQIEVLRGPQGTLFGRNATSGAISLVSKKPSGELNFKQTVGIGRFDQRRSLTHLDLAEVAGLRAKISYLHAERDGWVDNTAPDEWDYDAYNKNSGRVSLNWQINDTSTLDYAYDRAHVEASQLYFQFDADLFGAFGDFADKPGRQTKTRFPIAPLDPTKTTHYGHALTLSVELSDHISFKSLSSYRKLDNETRNNFGGALYSNGVIDAVDVDQRQESQEFRVLGNFPRMEFVSGLFYYREVAEETINTLFSLDIDGQINGSPLTPINPPTNLGVPGRTVESDSASVAWYGQLTWTPPVLNDHLDVTLGLRRTRDKKSGAFAEGAIGDYDFTIPHTDSALTLTYEWTDTFSTYAKWGTAFRSGGVNARSKSLTPFTEETVETYEVGVKSEFWGQRGRLNMTLFRTDYRDMIIDMIDPLEPQYMETINAAKQVDVDGAELEFTVVPVEGLTVGLSYTYLDGDMPLQPNPLDNGALVAFALSQTPTHAGSLTLDYSFQPRFFGTLAAHLSIVSTDNYHYYAFSGGMTDAYTLMNARLTLTDIPLGVDKGNLVASLWANNLTDEEYAASAVAFEGVLRIKAYGAPRTLGIDVTYEF